MGVRSWPMEVGMMWLSEVSTVRHDSWPMRVGTIRHDSWPMRNDMVRRGLKVVTVRRGTCPSTWPMSLDQNWSRRMRLRLGLSQYMWRISIYQLWRMTGHLWRTS
ncbi:unnamed protein product [Lupinus luteus]|uniref:Uncharacterized protein n=1 Tax=Lupinus luteus TaxID=3873 RepID=A0AAV1VWH8_LUPLU